MQYKMGQRGDEIMDFGFELKKESVSTDGLFEGYASTFGGAPDRGGDVVAKGCFAETLKEKGVGGQNIAMLWSHDTRMPIGAWHTFMEDEKGLFCKGMVSPNAKPDGVPVLDLLRMGGIKGLSIGYQTIEADRDDTKKIRTLKKVKLYEVSLVTFPMNTRASVTSVKSIFEAKTPRQLEDALRDADLPRDAAKYLVKLCTTGLRDAGSTSGGREANALLAALKDMNSKLETDLTVTSIRQAVQQNF